MELRFAKYNLVLDNITINGIYGLDIVSCLNNCESKIYLDKILINKNNQNRISIISNNYVFYTSVVNEEIKFFQEINGSSQINDHLQELLQIFGLDNDYLERIISSLSYSEKYILNIIKLLVINPNVVVFNSFINDLDNNLMKCIVKLLNYLKNNGVIVIINNSDPDTLYNITERVIIFVQSKLLIDDETSIVFGKDDNIKLLVSNNVDIPYFSMLTYKANQKYNAHLFYRKDVRDVIKDVYKSVS